MISNGGKRSAKSEGRHWHYLSGKNISGLLRRITSNNKGDFCCLNCLNSSRTKNKFELHKKPYENKDFVM